MHRGALLLVVAMLCACVAAPPLPSSPPEAPPEAVLAAVDPSAPVACAPQRPEVCTMIYQPVCAILAEETSQRQYSSPCNACADDRVVAYREGTCE